MMKDLKRIWKNYNKWEDFKAGFYDSKGKYSEQDIEKVKNILTSDDFVDKGVELFFKWPNSINHNLSYTGSNRKSYLGQAVICEALGFSAKTTAEIFTRMLAEDQKQANEIADKIISLYEENMYEEP